MVVIIRPRLLALTLLLALLGSFSRPAVAQTPTPAWTAAQVLQPVAGLNGLNRLDAAGNRYEVSSFTNSITVGGTTLTSRGGTDVVLVKYGPDGTVRWFRHLGTRGQEGADALVLDPAGNLYLAASTAAKGEPGGLPRLDLGNNLYVSNLYHDWYDKLFIVRYSPQGTPEWVQQNAPADKDYPGVSGMSVDAAGNLVVTGRYENDFTFAGGFLPNASYKLFNYVASFKAASGTPRFLRFLYESPNGPQYFPLGQGISNGDYYICINAQNPVTVAGTLYQNAGKLFSLVQRYRQNGTLEWTRQLKNAGEVGIGGIRIDADDNLYAAGGFAGPLTIGEGAQAISLPGKGQYSQTILLKLTSTGQPKWVGLLPPITPTSLSFYDNLALDAAGNVYCVGRFTGILEANKHCLVGAGQTDVLAASFTATGQLRWAQHGGSSADDRGDDIIPMTSGQVGVLGYVGSQASFGPQTLSVTGLPSQGHPFLAHLGTAPTAPVPCAPQALTAFPNPAAAWLYLPGLPLPSAVELLDAAGRRVFYAPQLPTCRLDVGGLAPGLYHLRATTPQGCQYTSRIVVK